MQQVSTIYARFISRELKLTKEEINKLFKGSSFDSKTLFQQSSMPHKIFFDFLKKVSELYNDEELSLKVGKKLTPMSLGELGNAILAAPTTLESFAVASNFAKLHATYMDLELTSNSNELSLTFIELVDLGSTQQFQTEVLLLLTQNVIEALSGKPFNDGELLFPFEKPTNEKYYLTYFNSPVSFGHQNASIKIPNQYLKILSPFHDPIAWKNYQIRFNSQLNLLMETNNKIFTKRVSDFLQTHPLPLPTMVETARSMNITERTLNRKLGNEGSSYRELRNSILKYHAQFYLKETNLTVDAIASQLGYKDFSSFRRSFKKWTNQSPQAYREKDKY